MKMKFQYRIINHQCPMSKGGPQVGTSRNAALAHSPTIFNLIFKCYATQFGHWILSAGCWLLIQTGSLFAQTSTDTLPVSIRSQDRAGLKDPTMVRVKTSATEFTAALSPIFNGTVSLLVDDEIMYPLNRYQDQGIFEERFASRADEYDREVALLRPQLRSAETVGSAFILAVRQLSGDGLSMQVRFKVKLPAIEGISNERQIQLESQLAAAGEQAAADGSGGIAVAKGIDAMRVMLEELAKIEVVEDVLSISVNPCAAIQPAGSNYYLPTGELVQFVTAIKPFFADYSAVLSPFGALKQFFSSEQPPQYYRALFRTSRLDDSRFFLGYYSNAVLNSKGYLEPSGTLNFKGATLDDIISKIGDQKFNGYISTGGNQQIRVDLKENDITQTYIWHGGTLADGGTEGRVYSGKSVIPSVGLDSSKCTFCTNEPGPGRAFYNKYYPSAQSDNARASICRLAQLFNKAGAQFAVNKSLDDQYWFDKMAKYYDGAASVLDTRTFEEALYEFMAWYADHFQKLPDIKDERAFALSLLFQPDVYVADIPSELRLEILTTLLNGKDHALENVWPKDKNETAIIRLLTHVDEGKKEFIEALLNPEIINKLFKEYNDYFDGQNYGAFIKAFMDLYSWYLKQLSPEEIKKLVYDKIVIVGDVSKPRICNGSIYKPLDNSCKRINIIKNGQNSYSSKYPQDFFSQELQGKETTTKYCICEQRIIPLNFSSPNTIVPIFSLGGDIPGLPNDKLTFAPAFIFEFLNDDRIDKSRIENVNRALFALDVVATIYGVKALTIWSKLDDLTKIASVLQVTRFSSQTLKEGVGETVIKDLFKNEAKAEEFLNTWAAFNTTLAVGEGVVAIPLITQSFKNVYKSWKDGKKITGTAGTINTTKATKALDDYFGQLAKVLGLDLDALIDDLANRVLQLYINANKLLSVNDLAKTYAIQIAEILQKAGKTASDIPEGFLRLYSTVETGGDAIRKLLLSLVERNWAKPELFADLVADLAGNGKLLGKLVANPNSEEIIIKWISLADHKLLRQDPENFDLLINLFSRISGSPDRFKVLYSELDIQNIIESGRKMGLDNQTIEDMLFVGSRIDKPINSSELIQQMYNWLNVVQKRGYPFLFNSLGRFEEFKTAIKSLLQRSGIPFDDVIIQGSSLRSASAKDIDIAVFVSKNQFDVMVNEMITGIRSRAQNPAAAEKIISDLVRQSSDGRVNSYYFNRPNGAVKTFNQELYEIINLTDGASGIDLSLMIKSTGFDMKPNLKL